MNDLEATIENSNASSFADDTRISLSIEYVSDTQTSLQTDLNNVVLWSSSKNIELHEKKFEYLSYRTPSSPTILLHLV